MRVSTKGRYALSIMSYLAKNYKDDRYIPLREISENENISYKYLEKIIVKLNPFLNKQRGNNGGYKLKYEPDKYKVGDILRVSEGDLAPVNCMKEECSKKDQCDAFDFWNGLYKEINKYVDSKTLQDYIKE